jgi:hypothetical protein
VEYRNRKLARVYLIEKGYPIGANRFAQLATTGEGPPFRYWGRYTVYTEADLDAWAESKFRTPGPNVGPASLLVPADHNKGQSLSPPTRQGRKYRKRAGSRKTDDQPELST